MIVMYLSKYKLKQIILFFLLVLPIYQDSPLSKYFGAAGYYILMPLSIVLIVLYFLIYHRFPLNKTFNKILKLGLWLVIISFVFMFFLLLNGERLVAVGEFLPLKAIKVLLQFFSYLAYIALIIILGRKIEMEFLLKCTFFSLILITFICIIEVNQIPYAFENLHSAAVFPYWRVRLLGLEASTTATLVITYSGLSFFYCLEKKNTICSIITLVCTITIMVFSQSKTLLVYPIIFGVIFSALMIKKINTRTILYFFFELIIAVLFSKFLFPKLSDSISTDLESYTSTATRVYTSLIGLIVGCVYPVGVGCSAYLIVLQDYLAKGLFILKYFHFKVNTFEIYSLINKTTDEALTVKSGIFHFNMYWGIIGTIYLFKVFVDLTKEIKESNLKQKLFLIALFWTEIIGLLSNNFTFEFWLLVALLILIGEKNMSESIDVEKKRK